MSMQCDFCNRKDSILENELAFSVYDKYPVNKGHMLIVTKRHFPYFFDSTKEERDALLELLDKCKVHMEKTFHPDGFNIGINVGTEAGQTIMHLHIHLIPRYKGDIENPRGGVRGVIPKKMSY